MVLMIVSGRSGSGKSVALRALEDMGFYCVDNLPESPEIFEQAMSNLPEAFSPQLLFLDADRNTLIRRYSDTRRLHPLSSKNLSLESAIDEESDLLEPLRSRADLIVDTSEMSVHELAEMLRTRLLGKRERELTMVFESFGFKHGIPIDADYVFDVRFLPNPYYEPQLRALTGLDKPVRDYVLYRPETEEFEQRWRALLDCVMPGYVAEGKQQLAIAVGCTGGQHRSVALAESTGDYLNTKGYRVSIAHRDLALAEGADGRLAADPQAAAPGPETEAAPQQPAPALGGSAADPQA